MLVQVAESTRSRQEFTRRFVRRAALRDTLVLALMVLGTAATLAVALRPLARLAREVQARSPDDMTPMADTDLPADIRPLVAAANQQMARTQDRVAQQRQFLDDAAHQLRTHLTTLQMQIDYARREVDATQVQHTLEAIGGEVARATRSTQQLLALGRSDTAAVELAPFDLAALGLEAAFVTGGGYKAGGAASGQKTAWTDGCWSAFSKNLFVTMSPAPASIIAIRAIIIPVSGRERVA